MKLKGLVAVKRQVDMSGYNIQPGVWLDTDTIVMAEAPTRTYVEAIHEFWHLVDDKFIDEETICRFTGIRSAEQDWYEHDILEHVGTQYVIIWHFNRWVLREFIGASHINSGRLHEIDRTSVYAGWFKIIGNIHDMAVPNEI